MIIKITEIESLSQLLKAKMTDRGSGEICVAERRVGGSVKDKCLHVWVAQIGFLQAPPAWLSCQNAVTLKSYSNPEQAFMLYSIYSLGSYHTRVYK